MIYFLLYSFLQNNCKQQQFFENQAILNLYKEAQMTYRATLQIVITMNELYLFNLRKQGQVRFKMNLYQKQTIINEKKSNSKKQPSQKQQTHSLCNPYNIARKSDLKPQQIQSQVQQSIQYYQNPSYPYNQLQNYAKSDLYRESKFSQPSSTKALQKSQSTIDVQQSCYYSKVFQTKFAEQVHKIQQSIFFKCCIPVEIMNQTELMIKVQILFSQDITNSFKTLGSFNGKIRKLSPISTYLPISFDQFQGFKIAATYHSTIMQFKFQVLQQQALIYQTKIQQFDSFGNYLNAVTLNFRRAQTKNFYTYYREFLERQLFQLQQRHSDLIRILKINVNQYRFHKVCQNLQIVSLINALPIFSTQKKVDSQIQNLLTHHFLQDFLNLKALTYEKWNQFVLFMTEYINQITQYYKNLYDKNLKERLKGNVFSHKIQINHDWTFSKYQDSGKKYQQLAENDRKKKKEQQLWSQIFPIEDQNSFQDQKTFIKIFEQIYPVKKQKINITARKYSLQIESQHQRLANPYPHVLLKQSLVKQREQNFQLGPSLPAKRLGLGKPSFKEIGKSSMVTQNDYKQKPQSPSTYYVTQRQVFNESRQKQPFNSSKSQHIIVLVHGYQASRQDFQVLKLCLEIRFKAKVFISSANQGRTDDHVEQMGKRLAVELSRYFQNVEFDQKTKISFIGHSLGGVIIRSALGFLDNIGNYLYTYMSFSSPHLGYLYEPSRLVKAGLWFMNSWQGSKCLNQICMKDSEDLRTSYFFRLSQNKSLNSFKHIALISSSQDGYIPYQSARIQKNSDILYNQLGDSISRNVILEMVDNIIGEVQAKEISRINVIFHIQDRNMDSLIGRTAHIKYLSDLKFIKMFFMVFQKFFT